jgi:hypothetical protein
VTGYFPKFGLFWNNTSDLTNWIFYSSFDLAGIGTGKVGFKALDKAYWPVYRKGFVVFEG